MREISRELGISRQTIYCWINAGELDRDLEEVRYCPRDTGVAGVSVSGTTLSVSGIASGTSAATVTASDPGGLSAAQTFSVDVAAPAPTTIAVMPDSATLTALDDTIRLTADVSDQLGRPIAPTVVWSSGDTSVVTVDSTGLAVAAGPGEATVTATAGAVSDSSRLTVDQAVSTVRLAPVADTLKALGDTLRMTAAGFDANGHPLEDSTFTWSSSDESVVTVDETGVVTAAGNGSATVTASSEGASDSASVTVSQRATDVHVSPKAHTLTTGETVQLAATAADKNGHMVAGAAFTWDIKRYHSGHRGRDRTRSWTRSRLGDGHRRLRRRRTYPYPAHQGHAIAAESAPPKINETT